MSDQDKAESNSFFCPSCDDMSRTGDLSKVDELNTAHIPEGPWEDVLIQIKRKLICEHCGHESELILLVTIKLNPDEEDADEDGFYS